MLKMEIKGIIDEVETQLHEQIENMFKGSSSSLVGLNVENSSHRHQVNEDVFERNWFLFTDDLLNEVGAGKSKVYCAKIRLLQRRVKVQWLKAKCFKEWTISSPIFLHTEHEMLPSND